MRALGDKNKTLHYIVEEKDALGRVIKVNGFRNAGEVADYLGVKTAMIYDMQTKKYNKDYAEYKSKRGTTIKKRGRYHDFFKKFNIIRRKKDISKY